MKLFIYLLPLAFILGIQCPSVRAEESILFQIRCFSMTTNDIQRLEKQLEPLKIEKAALSKSNSIGEFEKGDYIQAVYKRMDSVHQQFFDGCTPIFMKEYRTPTGVKFDFSIPFEGDTIRHSGIAGYRRTNTGESIHDYPDPTNLFTSVDQTFTYGSYRNSHKGTLTEGHDMIHILSVNSTQQLWAVIRTIMTK